MIIRLLSVALILAAATIDAGRAFAQTAFPAPLPGQAGMPAVVASPIPNGAKPLASSGPATVFPSRTRTDACVNQFAPLREAAEKHGKLIKAAADRRAPPDEACELIDHFSQAELKMIRFVEVNAARCGILREVPDRLRTAHTNTEKMQKQVCSIARQYRERPGPVGDFWPATTAELAGPTGDFRMVR